MKFKREEFIKAHLDTAEYYEKCVKDGEWPAKFGSKDSCIFCEIVDNNCDNCSMVDERVYMTHECGDMKTFEFMRRAEWHHGEKIADEIILLRAKFHRGVAEILKNHRQFRKRIWDMDTQLAREYNKNI